jgi:hypothetical protein
LAPLVTAGGAGFISKEDNMKSLVPDFDIAFATFFRGIEQLASNDPETVRLEMDVGPRYIRVVRVYNDRRSLHCFVDRTNGEILRGGWKQPRHTRRSRGNIFNADNGLGAIGKYGAAYLR